MTPTNHQLASWQEKGKRKKLNELSKHVFFLFALAPIKYEEVGDFFEKSLGRESCAVPPLKAV